MPVKVQPPKVTVGEKWPRLAEFDKENTLPEDEVRLGKRAKTSRYVEQQL
jgi:hypothetical protein